MRLCSGLRVDAYFCSQGDTAVALLRAGADATTKDKEGLLAIDLAPDKEVRISTAHHRRSPNGTARFVGTLKGWQRARVSSLKQALNEALMQSYQSITMRELGFL
jgi:hypothetical protein